MQLKQVEAVHSQSSIFYFNQERFYGWFGSGCCQQNQVIENLVWFELVEQSKGVLLKESNILTWFLSIGLDKHDT